MQVTVVSSPELSYKLLQLAFVVAPCHRLVILAASTVALPTPRPSPTSDFMLADTLSKAAPPPLLVLVLLPIALLLVVAEEVVEAKVIDVMVAKRLVVVVLPALVEVVGLFLLVRVLLLEEGDVISVVGVNAMELVLDATGAAFGLAVLETAVVAEDCDEDPPPTPAESTMELPTATTAACVLEEVAAEMSTSAAVVLVAVDGVGRGALFAIDAVGILVAVPALADTVLEGAELVVNKVLRAVDVGAEFPLTPRDTTVLPAAPTPAPSAIDEVAADIPTRAPFSLLTKELERLVLAIFDEGEAEATVPPGAALDTVIVVLEYAELVMGVVLAPFVP